MTRDQAIAAAIKSKEQWGGSSSEAWLVNALEALGVIKLDEPKSAEDKLIENLIARGFCARDADVVRQAVDYCDIKIVEK